MLRSIYSDEEKCLREMLRDARTKKGLRQADLASILGVPQSFVSKYESGERVLTFVEAIVILDELGLPAAEVVEKINDILNETKS
jgi:transcriptional regulator with XRE-family HTH domain